MSEASALRLLWCFCDGNADFSLEVLVFGRTENLLGALLRIKEVIRRRVESSEEEDADERGMTQRLEDILRESSGPLVAGRTKDFVQRILAASAGGQNQRKEPAQGDEEAAG